MGGKKTPWRHRALRHDSIIKELTTSLILRNFLNVMVICALKVGRLHKCDGYTKS